jgi:hypothetical protein
MSEQEFTEINCEQCYTDDHKVVIDYDDFISLAQKEAKATNSLNYILRALRLGVEPSIITAIFDENTSTTLDDLLINRNSPFYIPTDKGEKCNEQI